MKKLFFVSVLSILTVSSSYAVNYMNDYNLVTAQYVKDTVGGVERQLDSKITSAVANKVDKTAVISSTGTVTSDDTQIPTVKRMESEIEDALGWVKDTVVAIDQGAEKKDQILVTDSVGAVKTVPTIEMEQVAGLDGALNSKVANEQIVETPGGNPMVDYAVSLQAGAEADADMVSAVPSVNAVAESFVPADGALYDAHGNGGINSYLDYMQPGAYILTVEVDEQGGKQYVWRAMQIGVGVSSVVGQF